MREHMLQGISISDIAKEFGTPFYVYDGNEIEQVYGELRANLDDAVQIFYSLKPNPNMSIVSLLHRLGAGAEVCSMGEFQAARRAGVHPDDILFTGPGKSLEELQLLVDSGVRAISCESFDELKTIDSLAQAAGKKVPVLLRVNPAFGVQGGRLTMAGKPRQFGIDEAQVLAATDMVAEHPHVRVIGIHVYAGTRILDANVVVENTRRILDLAGEVADALGISLELVDIGGGIGIAYYPREDDPDQKVLTKGVNEAVAAFRVRHPHAKVALEPGRYLVGRSGIYVVRVRHIKYSRGARYVITDGGTHQNMAAVGTGSYLKRNFPMQLLSDLDRPAAGPCNVTGPLLIPSDVIGKNVELPEVSPGDLIGVLRSGAYGPTASIAYMNGQGYPAEVLVHNGRTHLIRKRDRPEDLLARQILVNFDEDADLQAIFGTELGKGRTMEQLQADTSVRAAIAKVLRREIHDVSDDTRLFEDLGLDSTSVIELMIEIEDRVGLVIDPDELDECTFHTVGTITEFVTKNLPHGVVTAT